MPVSRDNIELSADHLAYLLDTCGDGFVVCDESQSIVLVNSEAERLFGYQPGELLSGSIQRLMPERYRARHDAGFRNRLEDPRGMPIRYVEVQALRKDGSEIPIEVRFTFTPLGETRYFTASIRDVSAQVAARKELARRAAEIERLNDALERERDYLREEVRTSGNFGEFIGDSAGLKLVLAQIEAVAKTSATVLVTGESGVGKELVARAIHESSPRSDGPLVKVNCATIPRDLFESEFFGHRRGAFTGAVRDRVGRFELADHGTIFLDEVGEIPLELQSKLLRVLQEQEYERVGDEETKRTDVRVVAATNRDLLADVGAGRFREDLYYRLGVFPILVPPLRARREDVIPLAMHFLALAASSLGVPRPQFDEDVARRLRSYDWPGNVRELQNVMERATILASGKRILPEMLALAAVAPAAVPKPTPRSAVHALDPDEIRSALATHRGNIMRTAKALGLSRQALYRRLDKYGIPRPGRG